MGRVSAPFGVRGEVKVQCFGDAPAQLAAMPRWWLTGRQGTVEVRVEQARVHGRSVVARVEGFDDRDAAMAIRGAEVSVPRDALPAAGDGEYYWFDLEGMTVVARDGAALGAIESVLDNGAHSVLVVRAGEIERLIPFVAATVDAVDTQARVVTVDWGADWG
jgi:16S rRNA processing protein RimM